MMTVEPVSLLLGLAAGLTVSLLTLAAGAALLARTLDAGPRRTRPVKPARPADLAEICDEAGTWAEDDHDGDEDGR